MSEGIHETLFQNISCSIPYYELISTSRSHLFFKIFPHLYLVLLMVKDEVDVIVPTLETLITKNITQGQLDNNEVAYLIYDTGSTDGTEKKAFEFFKSKGIQNYHVEKEPFVNYSISRNRGIELVKKIFPQCTFTLFVDAEWYLNDFDSLLSYAHTRASDNPSWAQCYNIRLIDQRPYSFKVARLLRQESPVRFIYRVHELPNTFAAATPRMLFILITRQKKKDPIAQKTVGKG